MSDIFISYAREDRAKAEALADVFRAQGWSVWWDRNIPPGKSFDQVIEEQINAAKCMVVLWSATSVQSDWVKGEAGEGVMRKALVPVRIDETKVPLEFRRLQTVDLFGWDRGESHPEMAGLLDAISTQIKAPVKSVPDGPRWRAPRGLLFAIAVALVLLVGAGYFAVKERAPLGPVGTPTPAIESTAEPGETEIRSTRNMRLEFWQDDRPAHMVVTTSNGYSVVRVRLKQRPVEIRADHYQGAIQICAWSDDSIFAEIHDGMRLDEVPYFRPGTGMAPDGDSYTNLFLTKSAQHYLIDERLKAIGSNRVSFTFNGASNEYGVLAKWPARLYLVVFSDVHLPGIVEDSDYERIVLEFEK